MEITKIASNVRIFLIFYHSMESIAVFSQKQISQTVFVYFMQLQYATAGEARSNCDAATSKILFASFVWMLLLLPLLLLPSNCVQHKLYAARTSPPGINYFVRSGEYLSSISYLHLYTVLNVVYFVCASSSHRTPLIPSSVLFLLVVVLPRDREIAE